MRKLQLFGQAVVVAVVIATTGFTSAEAQTQGAPVRRPDKSFWDPVKKPPPWVPKNKSHMDVVKQQPPLRDTGVYSKERKHQGYEHTPAGAFARQQCLKAVAKNREATNKVYTEQKQKQRPQDQGLKQWYDKELRELAEAEQRCGEMRSDEPITQEAHTPRYTLSGHR
jgi:hypothetical protein